MARHLIPSDATIRATKAKDKPYLLSRTENYQVFEVLRAENYPGDQPRPLRD